ncbi:MAG: glycosyltransferase [Myxococcota bacterium]
MNSNPLITAGGALAKRLGYRKFQGESLSVLLLDGRYHLVDECDHALRSGGHRVARVPVTDDLPQFVRSLLWTALEAKPDFVLSINHIGFDEGGHLGGLLEELSLPVAVWYVDSPGFVLAGVEPPASTLSSIFCWEREWLPSLEQAGYDDTRWLPLATSPATFFPSAASIVHEGTFVGSSMQSAIKKWKKKLTPRSQSTARKLSSVILESERELPHRHLQVLAPRLNNTRRADILALATWTATASYRNELVRIAGEDLAVFGDERWTSIVPPYRYHGPVKYGPALARIYESSGINLNATSFQMPTAVNQRVFDAPAAGGFLLTDAQSDLEELFTPGEDVITFQSKDEFLALYARYRDDKSARQAVIANARTTILKRHTFSHRIDEMIQHLRSRHGSVGAVARRHS